MSRQVGAEKGLLHHVGRIELAPQPAVEVQLGQQFQVRAIRLERRGGVDGHGHESPEPGFALPTLTKTTRAAKRTTEFPSTHSDANPIFPESAPRETERLGEPHGIHRRNAPRPGTSRKTELLITYRQTCTERVVSIGLSDV